MNTALGQWAAGVAAAAVFSAAAMAVTPDGKAKKILSLVCGCVLILAALRPILTLDSLSYAHALASYREQAQALLEQTEKETDRLSRTIIEEECAAYILDKAKEKGEDVGEISVTVQWGGDCWYPVEMHTEKPVSSVLSAVIAAELGIPEERQLCG